MSDQDTSPQMPSDAELFKSAMEPSPAPSSPEPAPSPPAPAETPAEPAASGDPARDPATGRFMPRAPDQAPQAPVAATAQQPDPAATPPAQDDVGQVPAWRLRELREQRDAAVQRQQQVEQAYYAMLQQQRAAQAQQAPQEAPQVPDMIADPQAYHQYMLNMVQERERNIVANVSFQRAHDKHGEMFEHAYGTMLQRAENGDPSVVRAVMASPDPGAAMVNWYRRESTLSKVGDDPETWAKQWLREQLKDPKVAGEVLELIRGTAAPTTNGGAPNVQLPPSLNRMAAAAPNRPTTGDMSNDSLFQHAFREGRR